MMVDAVVATVSLGSVKRVEIRSPKFRVGAPLLNLDARYTGRQVKLISNWDDLPVDARVSMVNGCPVTDKVARQLPQIRGLFIELKGDNTIYVIVNEMFL